MRHPLILLFCCTPLLLSAQSFPLEKVQSHLANQHYIDACELIDEFVTNGSTVSSMAYYYQGKAYSQLYFQKAANLTVKEEESYAGLSYLLDYSLVAFNKSIEHSVPAYKKESLRQVEGMSSFLQEVSDRYFQTKNYNRYQLNIEKARQCNRLLANYNITPDKELTFAAIYAAQLMEQGEATKKLFIELREMGYSEEEMYQGFARLYDQLGEKEMAKEMIQKGRKKYPTSIHLLYQELDLYLEAGRYDQVISIIDTAIDQFDSEVSQLYFIKGSTCDQAYATLLPQAPLEADHYFKQAELAYIKAVELAPTSFDYAFNLAALYYNKALLVSKEATPIAQIPKDQQLLFTKAEHALQNTLALDQDQQQVIHALADIYKLTNQNEKLLELKSSKG